ncbi:BTAD domain-containing putative transcriptional regulator [Micromonospora rubida]|uniref:BTAD domain-containing putative transcriptional regulator n=1 Tax=Micromonospora rubida TaxID=2697657 RepID=A0ABW7SIV0_9ACTN
MSGRSDAPAGSPGRSRGPADEGPLAGEFRVLGPVEVGRRRRAVRIGGVKPRVFLLAMLLNVNRQVSLDWLTDALWDGQPPTSAVANLRTYAMCVRRWLAGSPEVEMVCRSGAYELALSPRRVDVYRFESLVADGRSALGRGDRLDAAARLTAALRLWRGPAGGGVPCGRPLAARLAALEEQRLAVAEECAEILLALDRTTEVIADMRVLLGDDPLREHAWTLLIRALHASGDAAGALTAYAEAHAVLAEQLGLDPGPNLLAAQRAVLNRDPVPSSWGRTEVVAVGPPTVDQEVPRQLPRPALFVGRDRECARLAEMVLADPGQARVVAVDGPPGTGKSALALRVAGMVTDRFPDGQLYADLGGPDNADPAVIIQALLRALGDPLGGVAGSLAEASARYRSLTAGRRLLVVIDNADDTASVDELLPTGAGCAALVTGRRTPTLDHADRLTVGALRPAEAETLIAALAGAERVARAPTATAEIARRCQHLPLVLRAVGALLADRPHWSLPEFLDTLVDGRCQLSDLRHRDGRLADVLSRVGRELHPSGPAAARLLGAIRRHGLSELTPSGAATLLTVTVGTAEAALDRLVDEHLLHRVGPDRYAPVGLTCLR